MSTQAAIVIRRITEYISQLEAGSRKLEPGQFGFATADQTLVIRDLEDNFFYIPTGEATLDSILIQNPVTSPGDLTTADREGTLRLVRSTNSYWFKGASNWVEISGGGGNFEEILNRIATLESKLDAIPNPLPIDMGGTGGISAYSAARNIFPAGPMNAVTGVAGFAAHVLEPGGASRIISIEYLRSTLLNGNNEQMVRADGVFTADFTPLPGLVVNGFNPNRRGHALTSNLNIAANTNPYLRRCNDMDIGAIYSFWNGGGGGITITYLDKGGGSVTATVSCNQVLFLTCVGTLSDGRGKFHGMQIKDGFNA